MTRRDIILVGASSGGVEALMKLVRHLPADLPAAVFVVVHVPPNPPSILHEILQKESRLPVLPAVDGAEVRHGIVTVAVSNRHLMFHDGRVRLSNGPRENRARPAIDSTFRSAALQFGARSVGVVLTGALDDGTAGLWAIKDRGGLAIVQAPGDAAYPSMPRSAIQHVTVDHTTTLADLPALLTRITHEPLTQSERPPSDVLHIENRIAAGENALQAGVLTLGAPSMNTCPHCHGTLMDVSDTGPMRFRCHTGHVFSPTSLLVDLDTTIDEGLWGVLRSIDERQFLLEQLIHDAKISGNENAAQEYARQAEDARMRADEIRALVVKPFPAVKAASG